MIALNQHPDDLVPPQAADGVEILQSNPSIFAAAEAVVIPSSHPTHKASYARIEEEIIDEEMNVRVFKTGSSNRWYMQFNDPVLGQCRPSLRTTNKKNAVAKAKKKAAELRVGITSPPKPSRLTLHDVLQAWLERLIKRERDETTIAHYRGYCRQFKHWASARGIRLVDQINDAALENFEDTLRKTGFAVPADEQHHRRITSKPNKPKTVRDKMKAIVAVLQWAFKTGRVLRLPFQDYRVPRGDSPRVEVFSSAEIELLRSDPAPGASDLWKMFLWSGARSGEICWLLKTDICQNPWGLHIRAKVCPLSGKHWHPKMRRERFIPLTDPTAIDQLKRLLTTAPGPYLFSMAENKRWYPRRLNVYLKTRLKALGITHGKIHAFRHTVASFLANHPGMTLVQVKEFLGHADIRTTLIYVHVAPKDLTAALGNVDFAAMTAQNPASKNAVTADLQAVDKEVQK